MNKNKEHVDSDSMNIARVTKRHMLQQIVPSSAAVKLGIWRRQSLPNLARNRNALANQPELFCARA